MFENTLLVKRIVIKKRKYRIVLIYKLLGDVNFYKDNHKKYFIKISCRIKKITIFAISLEKWQSGRLRQS